MGFIIKRLYVENYKLFDSKEIDFKNNLLSVFDGPNGYGKTSTFDAIEFLVTGTISRIYNSEVIAGTSSYGTVFLAKNPQKDVLIKGEFVDEQKKEIVIIGIRIRVASDNGRANNPRNLLDTAENYRLPAFDISAEAWDAYSVSKSEITEYRIEKFGKHNLNQFTLLHYIRQEDRLSYFKQSEKGRSTAIETLMGIEKESAKLKNAEQAQKEFGAKIKSLESQIEKINQILQKRPKSVLDETEYVQLLDGQYPWDVKEVVFDSGDEGLFNGYLKELDAINAYVKFQSSHQKFLTVTKWNQIPENMRTCTIHAWLLMKQTFCDGVLLENKKNTLAYLEKQYRMVDDNNLLEMSFSDLCKVLNISDLGKILDSEVTLLKRMKASQDALQKSVSSLVSLRERMHAETGKIEAFNTCPYCGTSWDDKEQLETQYKEAENVIKELLDADGRQYESQYKEFRTKVIDNVYSVLCTNIEEIKADSLLQEYCKFENRESFTSCIARCEKVMAALEVGTVSDWDEDFETIIKDLIQKVERLESEISDDYLQANSEFNFEIINSRYFPDSIVPVILTEENIELKKRYLHNLYMKSFDELTTKLQKLKEMKEKTDLIQIQMKEYVKALKTSISRYEKQIIDQIEIPFFVYSSRLLQSYQGGQGVLIKNDGKSIRFTSPGSEHDVLYTMSSGQLSAVLLSFSLAMNKIYAGEGIKTVFIDDPIQCMDDINMISFVELLRREFSDNQIIVSTHEEHFSNYIRYKFKKYDIETQAITLKDA